MTRKSRLSPSPSSPSARVASRAAVTLTDEEAFDLRCLRYRHAGLAQVGCGDPKCPVETCSVARHARLVLRALDALVASSAPDGAPASARTSGVAPSRP